MQVVSEGAVRSVVSSRGVAGYGALVDMAVVAAAPHAPCAGLLLAMVPGFRCHGGLLPFAALSLTNIIPELAFSIVVFASSSVSFVSPGRLFNHSDGGPPQRWGSPRRRSSPYRHLYPKSSSPIAIFARSSVSRVLFAPTVCSMRR